LQGLRQSSRLILGDYANLIRDAQLMQALNLLKSLDIVSQR
jgi:hypothetical protein